MKRILDYKAEKFPRAQVDEAVMKTGAFSFMCVICYVRRMYLLVQG